MRLDLAHPPEHSRQHAVAHRRLIGLALGDAAVQQRRERAQGVGLVLVAPQLTELGRERLQRRSDRLDREGERALGEIEPAAPGQRRVGHEGRGARRPVDQRHLLLGLELELFGKLAEQVPEGEDLARAAVATSGHGGQRAAVEHGGHRRADVRPRARVTLDEVGQASEHDRAHDALGQRLAERGRGPQPRRPGRAGRLREGLAPGVTRPGRDAVQQRLRVLGQPGVHVRGQRGVPAVHLLGDRGRELDALALPRDPPHGLERQVSPACDDNGHRSTMPHSPIQAMASISTSISGSASGACTVVRAGGLSGKNEANTSFIAWK